MLSFSSPVVFSFFHHLSRRSRCYYTRSRSHSLAWWWSFSASSPPLDHHIDDDHLRFGLALDPDVCRFAALCLSTGSANETTANPRGASDSTFSFDDDFDETFQTLLVMRKAIPKHSASQRASFFVRYYYYYYYY